MLSQLSVSNYALIDQIEVTLGPGLTIITGETGAGKSILLGALGLILGDRADSSSLRDQERKCVIEGSFKVGDYGLSGFFTEHELDYDDTTTLRREIVPGGKSRAFINDTPVNLNVLKELGEQLIDIHAQHQTRLLNSFGFQVNLLDAYAGNRDRLTEYKTTFAKYSQLRSRKKQLEDELAQSTLNRSFIEFQFNELVLARISSQNELSELEAMLSAEDLKI
ncbi:MAG: AAA family ATPase, partial [Bacteroidota bacterium]